MPAPGPFNYPRLVNLGASQARGEFLMTLNNDIEASSDDWLEEMLMRLGEPDVGAVGALLAIPAAFVALPVGNEDNFFHAVRMWLSRTDKERSENRT